MNNPCIKTGATVLVSGQWWHGDLFDFGAYMVLNCNAGPQSNTINFAHAEFTTWQMTFQHDLVVVFPVAALMWFDYDGRRL